MLLDGVRCALGSNDALTLRSLAAVGIDGRRVFAPLWTLIHIK
jgi:hypothetical protein